MLSMAAWTRSRIGPGRTHLGEVAALCAAIALAIIASGCAQPQLSQSPNAPPPSPRVTAERQLAAGEFEAAAQTYADLGATATEPLASESRLRLALIRRDLNQDADGLVPDAALADPAQETLRILVDAVLRLGSGDAAGAASELTALTRAAFGPYERGVYLRTLGRAQLALGDAGAAATNLIAAESFPMPPARRGELTHAIWDALQTLDAAAVRDALPPNAKYAAGWAALVELYAAHAYDPVALAGAIAAWQTDYPDHPAQPLLIAELLERSEEMGAAPSKIALLLPLRGPLADVGRAIRDGFIAMRFTGVMQPPPEIVVYDVNADNVLGALQTALSEGATFIVGPLEKNALDVLLARVEPSVPMLALNTATVARAPNARLFEFGLRPEDEAIDAAERAWRDGRRRMLAMVPASDLGGRVLAAFAARWQALGGTLVDSVRFHSDASSYANAVRATFGLAQSEARASALRRLLKRPIVSEARRRDDIDGILLSASPVEARQILPQFRFLRAADLPIYATSHVFSGVRDPGADQDLNGVMFGDAPWLLGVGDRALKEVYDRQWRAGVDASRFFAFGADACRIIPYLAQMRAQPGMRIAGATGQLYLDGISLVRRRLTWARFVNGSPQLLDPPP